MRNAFLVMKNNLYRASKDKILLLMVLIIMPIVIAFGVYFSDTQLIKGKIAVVGASYEEKAYMDNFKSEGIDVEFLEESVSTATLIKGSYLAEINFSEKEPKVICYGNEEVKNTLEAALKGEVYESNIESTTVQGKVIGFLVMFCFMGASSMIMDYFLSDRENGTYTRVLSGGVSYYEYIFGQIFYAIIALSLSSSLWAMALMKILKVELSVSYGAFFGILMLMGILSASFGMLIATIFKDKTSASMSGSIITMLSCLLGGCVVNIQDSNKVIGFIRDLIPQKRLIDLANSFNTADMLYIILIIGLFIFISIFLGKKQYEDGVFV